MSDETGREVRRVESGPRSVDRPVAASPTGAAARAVVATGTEPGHAVPGRADPVRPLTNGHWTAQGTAPSGPGPRPASPPVVPVGPVLPPAEAPVEPALICDRDGRIVQVNAALLGLAALPPDPAGPRLPGLGWRPAPAGLAGLPLTALVRGHDPDAWLARPDGEQVPVRLVRRLTGGGELCVVLPHSGSPGASCGCWAFDLATAVLARDDGLEDLYTAVGVRFGDAPTPVEAQQIAALGQVLATQPDPAAHRLELHVAGGRALDYAAHVEHGPDGAPSRLVGVVRLVAAAPRPPRPPRPQPTAHDRRAPDHGSRRFADLMAAVPGGVGLLDRTGRVIDANAGLCELLDVRLEMLRGRTAASLTADVFIGEDPTATAVGSGGLPVWLRRAATSTRRPYRAEAVPLLRLDGTTVWCELSVTPTKADDGSALWLVVASDVTERRRAAEVLRSAGTVDELTRLPNRAASVELVDRLLAGPDRDRVAVVCGDLDDFSRVNSSLGHEAGDDLLVTLAARLQRELPVGCTAARLSADEFMVICADHTEVGGPDLLARAVADLLRPTITVHGRPVLMTASVGVAMPPPAGDVRAADLLRFAEVAMQDVKRRQRRGGIGMATDGVVTSAKQALELEAELRSTIGGGGLVLAYQPVVDRDGRTQSAEALVRWPHPERGLISPGEFLPIAQRTGLLRELDMWVLRTAAREAATWPAPHGRAPAVAVNLAGLLPGDVDFLGVVTEIVAESGLAWNRLVLELVETSLVALPPHALAAMAELVNRGVRFAVDDFGTGYSSLARLKELPAQTIKIDRAFVAGVDEDRADFAVARAVVDMAAAMDRTTVAEGVETTEQFQVLRGLGVDAFQGWLFAKPLAASDLRERLLGERIISPAAGH